MPPAFSRTGSPPRKSTVGRLSSSASADSSASVCPNCAEGVSGRDDERRHPARRKIRVELSMWTESRNGSKNADARIFGPRMQSQAIAQHKLFCMIDAHFLKRRASCADLRLMHYKNGFRATCCRAGRKPNAGKRFGCSTLIARLSCQQHGSHFSESLIVRHRSGWGIRKV